MIKIQISLRYEYLQRRHLKITLANFPYTTVTTFYLVYPQSVNKHSESVASEKLRDKIIKHICTL